MKQYYIYILSNKNRTVLYIGYIEYLKRRIDQHEKGFGSSFTKEYNAIELVYFESFKEKKIAKLSEGETIKELA